MALEIKIMYEDKGEICVGVQVRLWDTRSRQGEELVASGTSKGWIGAIDADQGGNWIVGGGGARCMHLWHVGSRKVVAAMP